MTLLKQSDIEFRDTEVVAHSGPIELYDFMYLTASLFAMLE